MKNLQGSRLKNSSYMKNYTRDSGVGLPEIIVLAARLREREGYRTSLKRIPYILHMRLQYWTLEKIGNKYGLQRERISQLEMKGVEMIRGG